MPTFGTIKTITLSACACLTLLAGNATFTSVDFCSTCSTEPIGINNKGKVSGSYFDADGNRSGFFKDGSVFTSFGIKDALFFEAGHPNNNGQVACDYVGADGIDRPCVR